MCALSWKLLIIGLLSEYFATLLKRQYLKKIAAKCSIFLHQLYFFLWEGQGHFSEDKDQISSWEDRKERGKRRHGAEAQNKVVFFFLQNSHY